MLFLFTFQFSFGQAPPVFSTCPASATVTLPAGGGTITFTNTNIPALLGVSAFDPDGVSPITYSASPASVSCADIGVTPITVDVTDVDGTTNCTIAMVTVADGGPLAVGLAAYTAVLDGTGSVTVTAANINNGSSTCIGAPLLSIAGGNPTYTCAQEGMTFSVTLQASSGGQTSTDVVMVTVDDNSAPTVSAGAQGNISANTDATLCTAVVNYTPPTFDDNCGGMGQAGTRTAGPASGSAFPKGMTTVTHSFTDAGNNMVSHSFIVTVTDNEAPTAVCNNRTITLDGTGNYSLTVSDIAAISAGSMDNCPSPTTTVTPNTFTCAQAGTNVAVTVSISDGTNPAVTCNTAMVTVNDAQAPAITNCPTNTTTTTSVGGVGNCEGDATWTHPTVTDNCTANLTMTYTLSGVTTQAATAFTSGSSVTKTLMLGVTTVTYAVSDGTNAGTPVCSFTITTTDDEAPMATSPANMTVNNQAGNCSNTVSWASLAGTDNCPAAATTTYMAIGPRGVAVSINSGGGNDFGDFPVGVTTVDYEVADGATPANTATGSFTVTVLDNEAPVITCPPTQVLEFPLCNANMIMMPDYTGIPNIADNCAQYSVTQMPAPGSAIMNPTNGQIIPVTLTVTDLNPNSLSDNCTFNVQLDEESSFMFIENVAVLPTVNETCGTALVAAPVAVDDCGVFHCATPFPSNIGTFVSGACNPNGMVNTSISSSGPLTEVIDGPSNLSASNTITLSGLDPVTTDVNVSLDIFHSWNGDISATLSHTTADGLTTVSVSLFDQHGLGVSGPFGGLFGCDGDGMLVTFDDEAPSSHAAFNLECNTAPTIGVDGDFQPLVGNELFLFDNIDPNGTWTLTVDDNFFGSDDGVLNGWSLEISASGPTSTPMYSFGPGNNNVTWVFDDGNGNTASQLQEINVVVDNAPPTLTCSDITLELDENGQAEISGGTLLGEGLTLGGTNSNFATYCVTPASATTFSFAWSNTVEAQWDPFGYSIGGSFTQLTINNASGGTASQSGLETVTVPAGTEFCFFQNNDGSVASSTNVMVMPGLIGDLAIANWTASAAGATYNEPNISDVCGVNNPTILANGSATVSFDCSDIGANTVTVTANDINNIFGNCFSTVTIEDNTPPVFDVANLPTTPLNVDCNNIPAVPTGITATDNCGTVGINPSVVSTQTGNSTMCGNYNYTITRTWTATDSEGNQTVFEQIVQVSDNEAPIVTLPTEITVSANPGANSCFATVALAMTAANVSDNCAAFDDLTITNDATVGNGTTDASGDYSIGNTTVTFTVVDPCGKTTTHAVLVKVEDTTAPVASCTNNVSVAIPSGSTSLTLDPTLVDNGSFDNCGPVTLQVFRLAANGITQLPPVFECSEADGVTEYDVVLMVSAGGMVSTCETTVVVQDNTAPIAMCQDVTVFLDANGNASVTPAMIDNNSVDECSGIANITLLGQTDYTVANVGPNTVTLLVTDVNGNNDVCTATVTVAPPITCFDVDDNYIAGTGTNEVPLTTTNFVNVQGFQFTLEIDETVGTFAGVNNLNTSLATQGTFSAVPNATGDTMTVSWLNTSGTPLTLNAATLFTVTVDVVGVVGSMTPITFINSPTPPELIVRYGNTIFTNPNFPPCTDDGNITVDVTATLNVSGNIRTWGQTIDTFVVSPGDTIFNFAIVPVQGVANVIVSKSETHPNIPGFPNPMVAPNAATTDNNGDYTAAVQNQPGGVDLDLDPRKETDWLNGPDVSSSDLFFIQQHIVNNIPFTSIFEYVASDVNEDGLVTTLDIVLIQDVIVNPPGSPQPSIVINTFEPWRFVPAADSLHLDPLPMLPNAPLVDDLITLDNYTTALNNVDWIAVKVGQVNGSLNPLLLVGNDPTLAQLVSATADTRNGNDLVMQMENQKVTQDELISIPVYAKDYSPFVAWQFTFEFDENTLAYEGMIAGAMPNFREGKLGLNAVEQGIIGAAWYGMPSELNQEEPLFTLQFKALKNAEALSGLIDITSRTVQSETALINGNKGEVSLEFMTPSVADLAANFELHQNRPNPFNDKTLISFVLPEASSAQLTIFDISGRVLKLVEGDFVKGYNEVQLRSSEISATGVLYYKLESAEFTATKKMIILN